MELSILCSVCGLERGLHGGKPRLGQVVSKKRMEKEFNQTRGYQLKFSGRGCFLLV